MKGRGAPRGQLSLWRSQNGVGLLLEAVHGGVCLTAWPICRGLHLFVLRYPVRR